jgi:hypothetical protein
MHKSTTLALLGLSLLAVAPAAAQEGVEVGVLDCVIDGGTGFIVGSTKDISCTFKPANSEFEPEPYFGVVRKFGLDIGTTGQTTMQWIVVTPVANKYVAGALAGDYVGASAGVTVGIGAGANFLVGGSDRAFTLQPVSVEAQTGLNIAVGVSEFQLRSAQ